MKLSSLFRLRFMIPLLVLSTIIMIEVYETVDRLDDQEQEYLLFSRNVVESEMSLLQNICSDLIPNGEFERAQRRLEYAALDHQIVTMIITDEEHKVLVSNRREWLASPAPGICRYDKSVAESGRSTRQGQLISMPGQIQGYYPVALGASSAELRPQRFGTLYVEYDYSKPLAQARQMAYRDAIRQATLFILFALVLSALLHLLITRHIERLLRQHLPVRFLHNASYASTV